MGGIAGGVLDGVAHLRQSVRDILATRLGTRVMRRDYGSDLPNLVDAPLNRITIQKIYAATAGALAKWEPRIDIQKITIESAEPGSIVLTVIGRYLPDGRTVAIEGIKI